MTPEEFLRLIWPTEGFYCLAYRKKINTSSKDTASKSFYVHEVFSALEDVDTYISKFRANRDLFLAVLSLREREIDNPRKPGKTGSRLKPNMLAARAYFFDIDVGPSKDYPTQGDALAALVDFVKATQLPIPVVVSSGNGLHVYWPQSENISVQNWKPVAAQLRMLAEHHGLRIDPSRVEDTTSLLRVPGTFNHKDPRAPKPVTILKAGAATDAGIFKQLVSDASIRAGVSASTDWGDLPSNLDIAFQGTPPDLVDVGKVCAQVRSLFKTRGAVDEPAWVHGIIGTALYTASKGKTGEDLVHDFSSGHAGYDRDETDAKIHQRRTNADAPSSCRTIAKYSPWGESLCHDCRFFDDASMPNPVVAARRTAKAEQPVYQQSVFGKMLQTTIPDPPAPYVRLAAGGIARNDKNNDGKDTSTIIYDRDLYPIRLMEDREEDQNQQLWCVDLPRSGKKEFMIDSYALYDPRSFTEVVASHGIFPHKAHIPYLQDYMVAYIKELQKLTDADVLHNHLGWNKDHSEFVMPDKTLLSGGGYKPSSLSLKALRASSGIHKSGDLHTQIELLKFYNRPEYAAHKFFIAASLAAPLMDMTGQYGIIINATGESGASKSTALFTASGLWGDPVSFTINGTNEGATNRARNERVTVLSNYPICVDEITHMPQQAAKDLAMGISQPGHRLRLDSAGVERKSSDTYKATILLSTANTSLHGMLSTDNSAGTASSMRVFEIDFHAATVHEKSEADEFLRQIKDHYGHVGPELLEAVAPQHALVKQRVIDKTRYIDKVCGMAASERFWSAAALVLVINEIAYEMGLLPYDPTEMEHWLINKQIPHMRGVVEEEYVAPLALLANYLEHIQGHILTVDRASKLTEGAGLWVRIKPQGSLLAHYDMADKRLIVLKKGFKDYCVRAGANMYKILEELSRPRRDTTGVMSKALISKSIKTTLGAGTEYAKSQATCFVIDMTHPDVVGDLEDLVAVPPPKLKLVE